MAPPFSLFHAGPFGGLPFIRNLVRVNSLLYRQSTSLRQREMIGRFQAFEQAKKQNQPKRVVTWSAKSGDAAASAPIGICA